MYVVTKRFGRSESRLNQFNKQADAEKFIQEKLAEDIRFKVQATYGLYEGMDLLKEFTQKDAIENTQSTTSSGSGSSQGSAGSRSSFTPTPFNTAPRPAGMPHNWNTGESDEEKGGKK